MSEQNDLPDEPQTDDVSPPSDPSGGEQSTATGPSVDPELAAEQEALRQQLEQERARYSQLETAVSQYLTQQQQAAAQNPPPSEQPVNYDDLSDEWITDPGKASQALAQRVQQSTMQQVENLARPLLQAQAQTAKGMAQNDPKTKEVFERYGPEVEQMVATLPAVQRANPLAWQKAAQIVKAEHFDDLMNEKAQELAAKVQSEATEDGSGSGSGARPGRRTSDELVEKLESSSYGQRLVQKYGADGLRSHVNRVIRDGKLGVKSFDEYVDLVANTHTIHDPDKPGEWTNPSLTRETA